MYRIMIVEDDRGIAEALRSQLQRWDFDARAVGDFRRVADEVREWDPQLVLMDVALPFFNGYHWCAEIRKFSRVPILFLSSASDNLNIVMAINMGGDDFVAKPFDWSVLLAKIQALLRRSYDYAPPRPVLSFRGAALDPDALSLSVGGQRMDLTRNECRILKTLLERRGSAVSRETLMERLWETDQFVDENTLTVNVNRLRRKLDAAGLPDLIKTKHGVGYLVEDE